MKQKNTASSRHQSIKAGVLYFAMTTVLFAIQFLFYIKGNTVTSIMDLGGWAFFVTSCLSHGACLALAALLIYLPFAIFGKPKIGGCIMVLCVSVISLLIFLNMQVYDIYRFHINGFVLNMVTGSGASDIFIFDTMLYIKEGAIFILLIATTVALWITAWNLRKRCSKPVISLVTTITIGCTLFAHTYHIYSAFIQKSSVIKSQRLIPYYFPTTAYGFMMKLGFNPPQNDVRIDKITLAQGDILYPIHSITAKPKAERPNIVLIILDSWNKRSLDAECMPNTYKFANENEWYNNHFSCSNGTRSSIFGMFFSLSSYYWNIFESGKVSPLLIDQLLVQGYNCQIYPGASLTSPPFFRVVFQNIPHLNIETEGKSVWERDRRLTDNFINDMHSNMKTGKPFFSILFYDLPHSFQLTEDKLTKFQPSWKYADYTRLNNDIDPTEFFNLYRNTCYQVDLMLADVFDTLEREGIADNTIVIITGDHGQEFNENKKNFWGHNGNFSKWQVGVPLICRIPNSGHKSGQRTYRTTHYDIVPTLMTHALGVTNPTDDYSMGHLLSDSCCRHWLVVGSELNYAFIIDCDTILEKMADGSMEVTDAQLNPVPDYKINTIEFNKAIKRLNRFLK